MAVDNKGRRAATDWLLGAFSYRGLSSFALLGFFLLSLAATGLGFADLRAAATEDQTLPPVEIALIAATTLFVASAMVVALYNAFAHRNPVVKALCVVCYLFFAFWSVGFGYGFFWKELAGKEFTERQFQGMIAGVSDALTRTAGALETAEQAAGGAAELASARAQTEATDGGTCANKPASTPGEGPLMRSRFSVAERAAALSADVKTRWIEPLAARRERLSVRVQTLVKRRVPPGSSSLDRAERETLARLADPSALSVQERRALFVSVHEDARAFADAANDLRARLAPEFAQRLGALAGEVGADPARPGRADPSRAEDESYCWDVVLNERFASAAGQIGAVAEVTAPAFEFMEGPKATRAAFFNLASWIGGLLPGSAGASKAEFGEKEFLALFASIAVDLGILFLTIIRDTDGRTQSVREQRGKAAQAHIAWTTSTPPKPPRLAIILDEAPKMPPEKGKRGSRRQDRS